MSDPAPTTEFEKVTITGSANPPPSMAQASKEILKMTLDKIEAYGNDPSQVERDLEGGGLIGGIAGAFLKSQASKPGFKSNSYTMLAEMLPLVPEIMQNNPYQKDFPEAAKQGKEAFEATGLTQKDFEEMADKARVRADGALREWGDKIIRGFGTTSPDPYIARRQEGALRAQAQEAEATNKSLNEAQTRAENAVKKVDKAWAKDGVPVEQVKPAETVSLQVAPMSATPVSEAGQTR